VLETSLVISPVPNGTLHDLPPGPHFCDVMPLGGHCKSTRPIWDSPTETFSFIRLVHSKNSFIQESHKDSHLYEGVIESFTELIFIESLNHPENKKTPVYNNRHSIAIVTNRL